MSLKCKSCSIINKELCIENNKHRLIKTNFICPLCNKNTKWYSHINHELSGDALECKSCRNYIIYVVEPNKPWKDEIYLSTSKDMVFVMRNFEDNKTFISLKELLAKIKTIIVFS